MGRGEKSGPFGLLDLLLDVPLVSRNKFQSLFYQQDGYRKLSHYAPFKLGQWGETEELGQLGDVKYLV